MRILFLGDIVGRCGRDAITSWVPRVRELLNPDFVVANGENATQGNGITLAHAKSILASGVDCITLGDHAFDQRPLMSEIDREPRLLRPLNLSRHAPGNGHGIFTDNRNRKLLVISAIGRVFMKTPYDDPFAAVGTLLSTHPVGVSVHAVLIDFHAEATSEKTAMGHHCDGRATMVAGTHTHVPTSDWRILPGGTGYISDTGMCGDYHSVIGMQKEEPVGRFVTGLRRGRFVPATGEASRCGVLIDSDDATGRATRIAPVRVGGPIPQCFPED